MSNEKENPMNWLITEIAKAVAMKFIDGIVSAVFDPIIDHWLEMLGLGNDSTKEIILKALQNFGVVIDEKLDEQWYQESIALFDSLTRGVAEFRNRTREHLPTWWEQTWATPQLDNLATNASLLISNLTQLGLLGWQTYILAVSLRLRILATLNQDPSRDEQENIDNQINEAVAHHRLMCWKFRNELILPNSRFSNWEQNNDRFVLDYGDGFNLTIRTWEITDGLRKIGVSDQEQKLPDYSNRHTRPNLPNNEGWGPGVKHGSPLLLYFLYLTDSSYNDIKQILYERKSGIQYWIWSNYVREIIEPLQDVVFEWWKGSGLIKEIKHTAIRMAPADLFLTPHTISKTWDWEARGQIRARKDLKPQGLYQMIHWSDNRISFYAANSQFVAADQYPELTGTFLEGELVANKDWVGDWERFRLLDLGENRFALQASNGKYVWVDIADDRVIAELDELDTQLSPLEIVELQKRTLVSLRLKCIRPQDSDGFDFCALWINIDGNSLWLNKKLQAGDTWKVPISHSSFYVNVNITAIRTTKRFIPLPIPIGHITIDHNSELGVNVTKLSGEDTSFEYELTYEINDRL